MVLSEIGASASHEQRLLDRLEAAAVDLVRVDAAAARAREIRDGAVRAALKGGVAGGRVAEVAGLSGGMVSRIGSARRHD
ncbi:hypothetical protein [Ornithinimicrobium murale]|uniref:hypothetical protein n=1 Tax=Ornithinimicrobium murale TaxID=1050153 RepID=UPI000E0D6AA4|nr:hypothetical protein [Ornithinimicrobium murale]